MVAFNTLSLLSFQHNTLGSDIVDVCCYRGLRVGYTTVWSGIYECNEYILLHTVV